jgi:hypothetical protein
MQRNLQIVKILQGKAQEKNVVSQHVISQSPSVEYTKLLPDHPNHDEVGESSANRFQVMHNQP